MTRNAQVDSKTEVLQVTDPYKRESPFGSTQGILNAIQKQDMALLSVYLSPIFIDNHLTSDKEKEAFLINITQLVNQNSKLEDSQNISRDPIGRLDDTLPENMEKIGIVKVENTPDINLKRIDSDNSKIWVLPNDFLINVKSYNQNTTLSYIDKKIPSTLQHTFFGYNIGHILASILLMLMASIIGALLSGVIHYVIKAGFYLVGRPLFSLKAIFVPTTIICATYIYKYLLIMFEVEWLTRELTLHFVNMLRIIAISWLVYRIINLITMNIYIKILEKDNSMSKSIVFLIGSVTKASLFLLTLLFILNNFNVDVSSGVALLGLGGLAIALGAQKVIENLIGSVVVVADKPVDIGDFCRFGTTIGTVESIGIRSTRLRTLDRSLVTIPNGIFSSVEIENYDKRDKSLFSHTYAFSLNTDRAYLENLLWNLRKLLDDNEMTDELDNRVRVRFTERDCIKVEVKTYILTTDFNEFLEYQERLLLDIMELIASSNLELMQPSAIISTNN